MPQGSRCTFLRPCGSSRSEGEFAAIERFGVAAVSIAFHAPQSHESEKRRLVEPSPGMLRRKRLHDATHFLRARLGVEWHEHRWLTHITVVLGNLVFEDQMVPERVPGQFGDQPMVLVSVPSV